MAFSAGETAPEFMAQQRDSLSRVARFDSQAHGWPSAASRLAETVCREQYESNGRSWVSMSEADQESYIGAWQKIGGK